MTDRSLKVPPLGRTDGPNRPRESGKLRPQRGSFGEILLRRYSLSSRPPRHTTHPNSLLVICVLLSLFYHSFLLREKVKLVVKTRNDTFSNCVVLQITETSDLFVYWTNGTIKIEVLPSGSPVPIEHDE
ncbi:hypothetical protein GCK72_007665 [Caenorhabditis remanei]|uniref:Uncharacterized protein n=1 Tax=Caenorhabditis remanei TaxID=31234 RepID=A0A6A5HIK0_CAERE|nr:hypothetical protein GCK72_007657 [Caenorhabditis remanei]XP_053590551.1 hypothetical protein GCK72_007661 [Caenorhabditis remanei]XP_053590554.1 hypothetical protein GCK72_007665 [Caenorhabditis remanei]KAF1767698.1 hypothetical protein GCK72_007657 [Caenorhabditis remanei]KAF1767702.1 hypothetical protein GCK72_007661 [Caenorhabditis remanei]KAF1767706.1 hypothetical protein GCK72_007665 [Caenorhabditis remanei]